MKFEKMDLTRPFYQKWTSKFWKCRQAIRVVEIKDERYLLEFRQIFQKNNDSDEWFLTQSNPVFSQHWMNKDWFLCREKSITQPKDLKINP